MRSYAVEEVRRMLAHTQSADRVFFWLTAETGLVSDALDRLRALLSQGRLTSTLNREVEVVKG